MPLFIDKTRQFLLAGSNSRRRRLRDKAHPAPEMLTHFVLRRSPCGIPVTLDPHRHGISTACARGELHLVSYFCVAVERMRVVGKRKESPGDRAGLDALALRFGGGAEKGVFRYKTAEEANRDSDRWMSERAQRRMRMSVESP